MERRLRAQLTLSVFVVLAVLLALMFLGTYMVRQSQLDAQADKCIDVILKYAGELPRNDDSKYSDETLEGFYEMRYLVVTVDGDGNVVDSDLDHVATLDQNQARDMVGKALSHHSKRGYVGGYRYRVTSGTLEASDADGAADKKGTRTVVLLDRARQISTLEEGIASEARVYACGVLGVTAIFLIISKRIVRPVVSAHESQRQFVIDAGHDLRTPISIISADADVLSMDVGESEWIDDIKNQVQVMSDLTESLIVLTRASTSNERQTGVVNLSDAVTREARGFKARTLTEGHELACQVTPDVYVRGNEQYLSRMVGALVDNALKYSVEGGPIEVSLTRHLRQAEIRVHNLTEGVDPKEVRRWFERFYQSDQARTHETGGYGIGLSMVDAVARSHGGKARAEAAEDGSSVTMTVTLPTVRDPLSHEGRRQRGREGDAK